MNLGEVRAKVIEATGRDYLVAADGSDAGANDYINEAQRELDRLHRCPGPTLARQCQNVEAGAFTLLLRDCEAVRDVFCAAPDGTITELEKVPEYKTFLAMFPGYAGAHDSSLMPGVRRWASEGMDRGRPAHYCIEVSRPAPHQDLLTSEALLADTSSRAGAASLVHGASYLLRSLLWAPPADGPYTIQVVGVFHQPRLRYDNDQTYWTVQAPLVLANYAVYLIESLYGNEARARSAYAQAMQGLNAIQRPMIEEEWEGLRRLGEGAEEGRWEEG